MQKKSQNFTFAKNVLLRFWVGREKGSTLNILPLKSGQRNPPFPLMSWVEGPNLDEKSEHLENKWVF